jgi:hypothetical protein
MPPATCVRPDSLTKSCDACCRRGIAGAAHDQFLSLNPFHVDGAAYGGLIGDGLDASRLLQLHLNDGVLEGRRVLATDTACRMRQLLRPGRQFDHATGWFRRPTTGRGDWVEHFGAGAVSGASCASTPTG